MDIGEKIKIERKKNKLSQVELAEKSGLSIATIQGYEQGRFAPKMYALKRIASVLDTPVESFTDESQEDMECSSDYEAFIAEIKQRLASNLAIVPEHNLDEKYIASACRDYCESLRALEQAKFNSMKGV